MTGTASRPAWPRRPPRRRNYLERTVRALIDAMDRTSGADSSAGTRRFLQRLDARVKLAGSLALVFAAVFARDARVIAVLLGLAVAAGLASGIGLRTLARGVWLEAFLFTGGIALPALVLTPGPPVVDIPGVPWPVTVTGLRAAGYLLLRVETAATLAGLLVLTTPWTHVLKALRVFRVPVVFVVVLAMSYRYILLLLETARDMFEAHRARAVEPAGAAGARQVLGSVSVLLSKTVALSDEVYLAMRARGFRGEMRLLEDFRMRPADWLALSSFAALAAAAAFVGR